MFILIFGHGWFVVLFVFFVLPLRVLLLHNLAALLHRDSLVAFEGTATHRAFLVVSPTTFEIGTEAFMTKDMIARDQGHRGLLVKRLEANSTDLGHFLATGRLQDTQHVLFFFGAAWRFRVMEAGR